MDKRQSIHGNFNFTASVWLWWLRPPAWPDSCTLSGNYGNVIDCICAWLRHNPRVSKTGSEQTQHSPTALKILDLPVTARGRRLPPHPTSAPSHAEGGGLCTQGEGHISGPTRDPLLRGGWDVDGVLARVQVTSEDDRDARRSYFSVSPGPVIKLFLDSAEPWPLKLNSDGKC